MGEDSLIMDSESKENNFNKSMNFTNNIGSKKMNTFLQNGDDE
jgi:hypothetical protein